MAKETDIELTVGLSASDVKQSAKELGDSIKQIFESSAGTAMDSKMRKLQQSMAQTTSKAQGLVDKMTKLESTQVPTERYKELEKQIEKTEAQLAKMQEKWDKAQAIGKPLQGAQLEQFRYDVAQLENTLEYAKSEMEDLVASGKAFTLGSDSEQYQKLSNELAGVNNQSRILVNTWEQGQGSLKKPVEEADKHLGKFNRSLKETIKNIFSFKSASKSMGSGISSFNSGIKSGIKSLVRYGLGISSLFVLFNKLKSAAMEGIKSMVQWEGQNGRLNKSISGLQSAVATLKNNIGAMVAPLINALAPALTKIINLISAAIQKISMFIALLSGKKTITVANKVQSDYAGSLDKTAKSAKKAEKALKGYLSPLDEINKFESQKDDDNGGGGGGAGGPTFSEMPIDENMYKWLEKLQALIDYLKKLWGKFKEGFFDGLGDWKTRVDDIKKNLGIIQDALIDIFTDPRVLSAADEWAQSFMYMLGSLAGSVASIGLTIAQNLVGGIAKYLDQNRERIKQYLIDMFDIWTDINNQLAEFFQAFAYVFEAFGGENGQRITAAIIGIFSDAFMGVEEFVSKVMRDTIQLITQPFIDNQEGLRQALDGFLGVIATSLETIKQLVDDIVDTVNEAYDEYIKPVVDDMTEDISAFVGDVVDWWNSEVNPILQDIADEVQKGYEQYVKPVIEELKPLIKELADFIQTIWNTKVKPLLDFIKTNILPIITSVLKSIKEHVQADMKFIGDILHNVIEILRGIIKFISGVFTGDWSKAWEGVKQVFFGIMNGIISIAERAINKVIDILNGFNIEIPWEWAKEKLGTSHIGFNISHVSIPRLAQGAVIPPNKEFLAMLGDQKSGTNIETPLSTMVDAFNQALAQNGGAGGVKQITFVLPDRREIAKYAIEGGRVIQTSTGRNPFELA